MAKNTDSLPDKSDTAKREEDILSFWKEHGIFDKTLQKDAPEGEFIFFDGPPFATGLPHTGSLLSSIIKDVIPRYKTMRGYRVPRQWGWDCHGLPIETLVEKELGLKTKKDIFSIGIDTFNEKAREMVLQYVDDWEKYIDRVGRFVDFRHSYKTMDNSYIESVWWGLKQLHEKGLLYEGRKVLMYCPHDETVLAKAEIAMDDTYKDITEEAVTVKFELVDHPGTFFLAWTTTPWTLPGNVALAVGPDIDYSKIKTLNGIFIVATERISELFKEEYEVLGTMKGKEFVGGSYQPLFDIPALKSNKSYKVYAADFVTTGEGTGIVHTAVMYGEDDFALGQYEELPMVQLLDAGAHYNEQAPEFIRGKYIKQAEKLIKEDLENRGLLFTREMHTHSYPHCYRCGTALIYNAVASWFVNIQKIKEKMLSENEHVHWVPEHLKHGRFQHIVENAPDWTISRNRFWASPLPIWKEKGGNRLMVIGSLEELKQRAKKSGNRYFVVRHGEATHMIKNIVTDDVHKEYPLTQRGQEQIQESAQNIPTDKPIVLISSPVLRARESAELMAKELTIEKENIIIDERLAELGFGEYDGKLYEEYKTFHERTDWYTARPERGESFEDAKIRFGQALYEYESRYKNSTVVIVSHSIAFDSLFPISEGVRGDKLYELADAVMIRPAEVRELPFVPLPLNKKFELDLHRPYIDSLILLDDEGREYERIPEVVDCWVESASMPFAQHHKLETSIEEPPVADFIAEYIAQTRTWFYYMHALGIGLFNRLAFRNVVSTGTILASDGTKMSKSKGNYTDPLELMDRYGADALRFSLMGSVVMQSEDLNFRDDDVRQVHSRVIGILWNSYKFFELYKDEYDGHTSAGDSENPLDRWILSRLGQAIRVVTDAMEAYTLPPACRSVREFIDDYSTWYLRRSRDRVKGEGEDKQYALATQQEVLISLSKLLAPVTPFLAEDIYKGAGGKKESVHLAWWPEELGVDENLLSQMHLARAVASKGLELRDSAGIKVRQPLALLEAKVLPEDPAIRALVAEELNVKKITQNSELAKEVWLDTQLTDELREEGALRDTVRAIQELRKEKGLSIADRPALKIVTTKEKESFFKKYCSTLMKEAGLADIHIEIVAEQIKDTLEIL